MKQDAEVRLMLRERAKGRTQEQAAARAGMSVRTARAYERRARLPSQLKQPRTYRSRPNPFADDWPWIAQLLEDDPALQGQTLFGLLCERQPGRYQAGQLRTLQRHIASWRAQYGPNREVMFPQVHEPGEAAQSDFTYMNNLGVTLGGVAFPHLVYHLVLVYSNIEAVQICFSESFESLVEGFETCLWQIGGYVGDRCQEASSFSWASRARSPSKMRWRPTWPLAAASSRCLIRMGVNSVVVTK
jgi:transcriptional regulator with XRE-family HTH domain